MGFRINSTGRKRILREHIQILLDDPKNGQPPSFTVQLELSPDLKLDPTAKVYVEPYVKSSSMRFDFGTVGSFTPPSNCLLSDIDVGAAILFRIKVVDETGEIGRILASANGIRPENDSDGDDRRPLLPVSAVNLGEEIWQLEVDTTSGPTLKVNSLIPDLIEALKRDPILQGLIYPEVVRRMAYEIFSYGNEYDETDEWVTDWKFWFNTQVGREIDESEFGNDDAVELIAEEITSSFAVRNKFASNWIAARQHSL